MWALVVFAVCVPWSGGFTPGTHFRSVRLRAAVVEPPPAAEPWTLERLRREAGAATAESYASGILELENAVDAVRALDVDAPLASQAFGACLEVIARSAPEGAAGALVGHTMVRLRAHANASSMCLDKTVLSPLAAALLKARKNKEAWTAVDTIRGKLGPRDMSTALVAAARLGDVEAVNKILRDAVKALKGKGEAQVPDASTLKFALKVLAKAGEYRTPFAVLEALPVEARNVQLYHAAIAACGKPRPPKGKTACLLWKRMKADGFRDEIPRATYNALLHCTQGASDADDESANANATTAILAEMRGRGIGLNVVSYNIALNSLAEQGRFSEIINLLEHMEDQSITPTAVTFATAIHGAAQANNSAAAIALLRAHVKHCDEPPADAAFGAALTACLRDAGADSSARAAQDIIGIMCDTDVSLERQEAIEALARDAIHRGTIDSDRIDKAEQILGMVLHNRQGQV